MTIDITGEVLAHSDPRENRVSTFWVFPDGGMRVRVKNRDTITLDEYSYADRIALARHLLQSVVWGAGFTVQAFADGVGGPNEANDRLRYVDSFGPLWRDSSEGTDLQTWIDHQDSSRLVGKWDDRIKEYFKDRGY